MSDCDKPLLDKVIENRNCIGCGACAFAFPEQFAMRAIHGSWQAQLLPAAATEPDTAPETICPHSGAGLDETEIGARLYPQAKKDPRLGRYRSTLVGHVEEGGFRAGGSSGGMITWLLADLLERGEVDGVVHVRPAMHRDDGLLFEYAISTTVEQVQEGAKSRYYPIEMSGVLKLVNEGDKRFAFVGIPCFVKAVRQLQFAGLLRKDAARICVGLVCGHLKSKYFGEYLAWQAGVAEEEIETLDFRHKLADRPASQYGFAVSQRGKDTPLVRPMQDLNGKDWGEGLFKNPACEFCDDVFAECADISVGDAWLPRHVDDPAGTNVVVIRDEVTATLVQAAIEDGRLSFEEASCDTLALSQAAGLRHRRAGLSHRLARRIEKGIWAPRKRVEPALAKSPRRRLVYDYRLQIAETGAAQFEAAKAAGDVRLFEQAMAGLLQDYRRTVRDNLPLRLAKKAWRFGRKLLHAALP